VTRGRRPPALVYGRNPVVEAIRAGRRLKRLLLLAAPAPDSRLDEIAAAARAAGVPVEEVGRERLDAVAHTRAHQGVVAYVERRPYWELGALLDDLETEPAPMVVVLDGIQDPQNLGGVCRSADAAGVAAVILPKDRAAEVTPAVAKASAGAVEHLRICQVASVAQALERLKAAGFWTIGLAGEADATYADVDLTRRTAIVAGAEGAGLHQLVRRRCDQLVALPMLGRVSSLNVAVAVSVVLYEALRQRGHKG